MNLLYANPLTLGLQYLLLMSLGTTIEELMDQFYEGVGDRFKGAQPTADQVYDFIVVGGGSTGSVVASRLSENGDFSVLLIEAGSFPFPLTVVPALALYPALLNNPRMNWLDKMEPQANVYFGVDQAELKTYRRPKVVGGGSVTNYMMFMRGNPKDYDRWANVTGDSSWTYENLLPYFKKLENYTGSHGNDSYHSNVGPMHGEPPPEMMPLTKEYIEAGKEMGYDEEDPNSYQKEGVYRIVNTAKSGRRWSAHDGYIYPALERTNFKIEINSEVTKILLSPENQVDGVVYTKNNETYTARVRKEVIVSAGAVGSPKLLLLSGIGSKDHLNSVGIPVKLDLPAVGQNMQDHQVYFFGPVIYNKTKSSGANFNDDDLLRAGQDFIDHGKGFLAMSAISAGGHFLSSFAESAHPDLLHFQMAVKLGEQTTDTMQSLVQTRPGVLEKYLKDDYGRDAFLLLISSALPKSRGEVKLRSSNPFDPPIFDPKYLTHEQDIQTVIQGSKLAHKLLDTKSYRNIDARHISTRFPGCEAHGADLKSDAYIKCMAQNVAMSFWHFSSTCAMGPSNPKETDRSTSVVDSKLRVHGVKGLRIADSSVMPFLVNANTNIPCIMIGEKAADEIKRFWSDKSSKSGN